MRAIQSAVTLPLSLVYLSLTAIRGESFWDKLMPSSLTDIWKLTDIVTFTNNSPLEDILLHFIERFREGLIEADGEDLYFPNFDWIINGTNLHGTIRTYDMKMSGLHEFKLNNLTVGVLNRTADLDVVFPTLDLHGDYHFEHMTCSGLPIWGSGKFSIKMVDLDFSVGGKILDTTSSILVTHPQISQKNIIISVSGLFSDFRLWHVLLILLFTLIFIVGSTIFLTLYFQGAESKLTMRYSTYKAVS